MNAKAGNSLQQSEYEHFLFFFAPPFLFSHASLLLLRSVLNVMYSYGQTTVVLL